ncbi:MAG: hypothetical protein ACRDZM_01785 [Acidimicrobiia bacterium]
MRVGPIPDDFQFARDQLHQIAFYAIAPARYDAMGRMGLRPTPGGFGTPEFEGRVARVEGGLLVHEQDGNVATQSISTIRGAAEFFGIEYEVGWFADFRDPPAPMDPDRPLNVGETPSLALGEWFRFGFEVLDQFRARGDDDDDVSEVQLWPEHFDAATEIGDADLNQRASYGASPGDEGHLEPYLYVSPWSDIDRSNPYWNDRHFDGSSLRFAELMAAEDQARVAHDFFEQGYRILHSPYT